MLQDPGSPEQSRTRTQSQITYSAGELSILCDNREYFILSSSEASMTCDACSNNKCQQQIVLFILFILSESRCVWAISLNVQRITCPAASDVLPFPLLCFLWCVSGLAAFRIFFFEDDSTLYRLQTRPPASVDSDEIKIWVLGFLLTTFTVSPPKHGVYDWYHTRLQCWREQTQELSIFQRGCINPQQDTDSLEQCG